MRTETGYSNDGTKRRRGDVLNRDMLRATRLRGVCLGGNKTAAEDPPGP